MSGIAIFSKPFILLIFGHQWFLTANILRWLAPTAIIECISTTGSVFMAKGRTDTLMKLGIIGAILQVGAFLAGVNFDITVFAIFYLIANVINFFPVMFCIFKIIGESFYSFFKKITPIIISTIIMVISLIVISNSFTSKNGIQSIWILILLSIIGALIYTVSILTLSTQVRVFLKGNIAPK
ncbi:polysaccharide biosynthesis C-terminal domain-containing protein [Gibbsiella quercinecans]|uniref:polysaccharide biosynthesis C-terminal domain-containing protein n=1 Tax=Gibbsiella quercinecans TaxID=929813 RepID=UPI003A4D5EE4